MGVITRLLVPPGEKVIHLLLGWQFSRNQKGGRVACVVLWSVKGGYKLCFSLVDSWFLDELFSFSLLLHCKK